MNTIQSSQIVLCRTTNPIECSLTVLMREPKLSTRWNQADQEAMGSGRSWPSKFVKTYNPHPSVDLSVIFYSLHTPLHSHCSKLQSGQTNLSQLFKISLTACVAQINDKSASLTINNGITKFLSRKMRFDAKNMPKMQNNCLIFELKPRLKSTIRTRVQFV